MPEQSINQHAPNYFSSYQALPIILGSSAYRRQLSISLPGNEQVMAFRSSVGPSWHSIRHVDEARSTLKKNRDSIGLCNDRSSVGLECQGGKQIGCVGRSAEGLINSILSSLSDSRSSAVSSEDGTRQPQHDEHDYFLDLMGETFARAASCCEGRMLKLPGLFFKVYGRIVGRVSSTLQFLSRFLTLRCEERTCAFVGAPRYVFFPRYCMQDVV